MKRTRDEEIKRALKIIGIDDEPKEDGQVDDAEFEKDTEEFVIHRPVSNNIVKRRSDESYTSNSDQLDQIDSPLETSSPALLSLEQKWYELMLINVKNEDCPSTPPRRFDFIWKCRKCNDVLIEDTPNRLCGGVCCKTEATKGAITMNESP